MIYLFDTSAINQLADDIECDAITRGLVSTNTVYITALSVAEAFVTKNALRRQQLIQLEKVLARGEKPIILPLELLQIQCLCHTNNIHRQSLPLFTQDPIILHAYKSQSPTDETIRDSVLPWKLEVENSYKKLFQNSRQGFQSLFTKGRVKRPRSFAKLIRDHYGKDDDFLYEYASPFYERASGKPLRREDIRQLLLTLPEFLLALLSYAYSVYVRAIQEEGYSPGKNPGAVDVWSAIYLPHCDYFVTHDKPQWRALRRINLYNTRDTKILLYDSFRTRLLMG